MPLQEWYSGSHERKGFGKGEWRGGGGKGAEGAGRRKVEENIRACQRMGW